MMKIKKTWQQILYKIRMKPDNEFVRDIHRKQLQTSFHGEFHKCCFFIDILLKIVVFVIKPKLRIT